jgi:hypothetical protein
VLFQSALIKKQVTLLLSPSDLRDADLDRALEVDNTRTLKRASQEEDSGDQPKRFSNFHTRPMGQGGSSDKSRRDSFQSRRRRSTPGSKRPDLHAPGTGAIVRSTSDAASSSQTNFVPSTSSSSSSSVPSGMFDPNTIFGLPQTNFSSAQSARSTSILGLPPNPQENSSRPPPPPSFDALFDSIVGNVPGSGMQQPHDFAADGLMPGVVDASQSAFFNLPLSADPSAEDWCGSPFLINQHMC